MIRFNEYSKTYDQLAEGKLTIDAFEELSLAGRRSLARSAKKNRMKLARGRKIWRKRKAGTSRIINGSGAIRKSLRTHGSRNRCFAG